MRLVLVGRTLIAGKVRWDRLALDAHLDELSGIAAKSPTTAGEDDADAALERFFGRPDHSSRRSSGLQDPRGRNAGGVLVRLARRPADPQGRGQ